jgi:4-hydroxybenzoate polyprenyltransferase
LWLARLFHVAALGALATVGWLATLHPVYWVGWLGIAVLLVWEHRVVRADDLSRVGVAFFNMNGVISVLYLVVVLAAVLLPRP